MKKKLIAIACILSLCTTNILPVLANENDGDTLVQEDNQEEVREEVISQETEQQQEIETEQQQEIEQQDALEDMGNIESQNTSTEVFENERVEVSMENTSIPENAGTYNGHYYYVFPRNNYTWSEAEEYCESLGGYLATIANQGENDYLYQLMTDAGYASAMFGLSDLVETNNYQWVTGEPAIYTNWANGEPNSSSEHYGMFYEKYTSGQWNDGRFSADVFLCEWGDLETEAIGACGDGVNWVFADGKLIISGEGTIKEGAFSGNMDITEVVIEEGITEISSKAFWNCTKIKSVKLPNTLTTLTGLAFGKCTGLTSIEIPKTLTTVKTVYYSYNDQGPFYGCSNLENVTLEEGIEVIPYYLLAESGIKVIHLPDSVKEIGERAFWNCTALEEVKLSKELITLTGLAFGKCTGLTSIEIPKTLTTVKTVYYSYNDQGPFYDCSNLKNVTIEEGAETIPQYLFAKSGIAEIQIPDSVKEIKAFAFWNCTELEEVTMSEQLTTLTGLVFGNCTGLTSIKLPKTLTTVNTKYYGSDYQGPFYGCSNLENVTLEEEMEIIPQYLFKESGITTIQLPDSIKEIQEYVFGNCIELAEISLPAHLEEIEGKAFYNCDNLTEITIPKSVIYGGGYWFEECDNLRKIVLEEGTEKILDDAFRNLKSDFAILIPVSVISIGNRSFEGCDNLKDVYYGGTEEQWKQISVGTDNTCLGNATIYYEGYVVGKVDPPASPVLTAAPSGHKSVSLSWEYNGSMDYLVGFRLYRSIDNENFQLVKNLSVNTYTYQDTLSFTGSSQTYYYKLAAVDVYDRMTYSEVTEVTAVSSDQENPVAVIGPDNMKYAEVNEEISLTASASTDNDKIASYQWDFGDGSSAEGKEVSHVYTVAGNYTIMLSVTDASGNIGTISRQIEVIEITQNHNVYSRLELNICDASSLASITGAEISINKDDITDVRKTGSDGKISCILPNGRYTVSVCAEGYLVRTVAIEASGGVIENTIGLTKGSIMSGSLTTTEMTRDEIIEAGIDPDAEGNEHVYRFKTTLSFVAGFETYELPYIVIKNEKNEIVSDDRGSFFTVGNQAQGTEYKIGIFPITESFALVIYGEAHWLKEMYKVELVVMNHSNTDTLEQVAATLNLPQGLSLADMTSGTQSATQELGTIGYESTKSAQWYVRGDEEGEYNISADVSAVTMPYGEQIQQKYTTDTPIKVYAGSALHMTITADDAVKRGEDYTVKFRLENVSDKSIYNLTFGINRSEQYKVIRYKEKEAWLPIDSATYGDDFKRQIDELAPGGYVEFELSITIWFFSALELIEFSKVGAFVDVAYYLTDIAVVGLEGNTTTIPYSFEINQTERENLLDKIANDLLEELYGDELPGGSLGGVVIEVIGEYAGLSHWMISGAKTLLKLQQGETDHTLVISIDDGLGNGNSIYNDRVSITTGDDVKAWIDTLNGTKLKMEAGEVSIQAKGPGNTKIKIGVENSLGELEREYILDVTIEDVKVKSTVTLEQDAVSGDFVLDENTLKVALEEKQEQEKETYMKNPYLWFDSNLTIDVTGNTSDSNYSVQIPEASLNHILDQTATTQMTLDGKVAELTFDREVLSTLAQTTGQDLNVIARRLSDEEAEELGSEAPTYQFSITAGDQKVTDFEKGKVYISLPYTLQEGENADDIYVEHIKADGSIEKLDAQYDSSTGTVNVVSNGFSYFRIISPSKNTEFQIHPEQAGTWKKDSTGWWYAFEGSGYAKDGIWMIDGKEYAFNSKGYMVTGWYQYQNHWFYFTSSGAMKKGWLKSGGKWYYLASDTGVMYENEWLENTYYLKSGGAMATGWQKIDGKWYYFQSSGAKATGWMKSGSSWYYFDPTTGIMYESEWLDDTYYLKNSGAMATGWQLIGEDYYYFDTSGKKVTGKWVGNYYLKADGVMARSEWVDNDRYYVDENGKWVPGKKR